MKKIYVYSRYLIETIEAVKAPHIIVSINCPDDEPPYIRTNRATLGRVNLFFWDLDKVPESGVVRYHGQDTAFSSIKEEDLCQPNDVKKIIDLVEACPDAEEILIHCTAGISRSSAVAAALHKVLNGTDEPIFGNKRYRPNLRVYRMMLEEWYKRHPIPETSDEG